MRTKGAARITPAESTHMCRVKSVSCVLCGHPPPVEAHHVIQGLHMTTIAVCDHCHRGPGGIHGDGRMLRLRYGTADLRAQVRAINDTLAAVAALGES